MTVTRSLAANVWVDGVLYPVGSTPPKDVADQITNPAAWGETNDEPDKGTGDAEKPAPAKKTAARKTAAARKPSK